MGRDGTQNVLERTSALRGKTSYRAFRQQETRAHGGKVAAATTGRVFYEQGQWQIVEHPYARVLGRSEWNMKKRAKSKTVVHELKPDQPLTARQKREIQALASMPE